MPFDASNLTLLLRQGEFSLWNYSTSDTRATTLSANYFLAARDRLQAGDVIVLHAADGLSFLPAREAAAVGNGLVLDTAAAPSSSIRSAATSFEVTATARTG